MSRVVYSQVGLLNFKSLGYANLLISFIFFDYLVFSAGKEYSCCAIFRVALLYKELLLNNVNVEK